MISSQLGLDIRLPIGVLFAALGLLLGGYGLATGSEAAHQRSLSVNINLWWGLVMLVFGLLLLVAASRRSKHLPGPPGTSTGEGQATESRERRLGLESESGG